MKIKRLFVGLCLVFCVFLFVNTPASAIDHLLRRYDSSSREFKRFEMGNRIVYFHQRMIDNAFVEKDFIVYQFERDTEKLLQEKRHWRSDLPRNVLPTVTRSRAETEVEGEVFSAELYIISPDSDVFPLEPPPENPCWVVRSVVDGNLLVTITDAVNGEWLGYGIPPPQYTSIAFSGPIERNPCRWTWDSWYQNAADWFETMGYIVEAVEWPSEEKVKGHIQSSETAMFYELAHGNYTYFSSGCSNGVAYESTTATEVGTWIADYAKMPFAFIGSCDGMCGIGPGTFSYEFRKGSLSDTTTVGYCGMAKSYCSQCWTYSVDWQNALFSYMNNGDTVKEAYDKATADYPMCFPVEGPCMEFAGDEEFVVVPVVTRDPGPMCVVPSIDRIEPSSCEAGNVISIIGSCFGATQADSVIHLGSSTVDSSSPRIKLWSDTEVQYRLPNYRCQWFKDQDYRQRKVWVTVDSVDSNKRRLKILKPDDCP